MSKFNIGIQVGQHTYYGDFTVAPNYETVILVKQQKQTIIDRILHRKINRIDTIAIQRENISAFIEFDADDDTFAWIEELLLEAESEEPELNEGPENHSVEMAFQ